MLEGQASAELLILVLREARGNAGQRWAIAHYLAVGVVLVLPERDASFDLAIK